MARKDHFWLLGLRWPGERADASPVTPAPVRLVAARADVDALADPLSADPVVAAEQARDRLADDLHGGLLQSLVVVRHALARGATAPVASGARGGADLPTADEALADCLAEARALVWHLRPRTLDGGIAHALDELAHRLDSDGGPRLVPDASDAPELSVPQATVVYRLVQAVARAAAPESALAASIVARGPDVVVRVTGASSVAGDAAVVEWVARATSYGVVVELVQA